MPCTCFCWQQTSKIFGILRLLHKSVKLYVWVNLSVYKFSLGWWSVRESCVEGSWMGIYFRWKSNSTQVMIYCTLPVYLDFCVRFNFWMKLVLTSLDFIFRGNYEPVQILQRHHFASHLKRMSTVVRVQDSYFAFVKVRLTWVFVYWFTWSWLNDCGQDAMLIPMASENGKQYKKMKMKLSCLMFH